MGIIPGTIVVKKYSSIIKGPIVLEKDAKQLAIGFGIAQKILVEPVDE
jgi:Fe2+ transport system protein FeoA